MTIQKTRVECVPRAIAAGAPLALTAAVALGLSQPAAAEVTYTPYASAGVQYNTNVFAAPSPADAGVANLGDTIQEYILGLTSAGTWGKDQDNFKLDLEGRRFNYDRFSELDHFEWSGDGLVKWHLGDFVTTILSYVQTHSIANFADTLTTQLEINNDRTAEARFQFLVTPEWRLDLAPKYHEETLPLPGYPDFKVDEKWGEAAVNYLGITSLTAGLQFDYTDGTYSGIYTATRYHQDAFALTAVYQITEKSDFNGNIGYTSRNTSLNPGGTVGPVITSDAAAAEGLTGKTSTVTGHFGYDMQITPKTRLVLKLFRDIDSYVAGANTQIGTGGSVGVEWIPDFRFAVNVDFRDDRDSIEGDLLQTQFAGRVDNFRTADFQVKYFIDKWFNLRLYGSRDVRGSNYVLAQYHRNIIGIELDGKLND